MPDAATPPADDPAALDARVLIVTPTRRDADVTCRLLGAASIACTPCADLTELEAEIARGAGAVVMTEVSVTDRRMPHLVDALAAQPPWSDVPVIVLSRGRDGARAVVERQMLARLSNVTLLDFPSSSRTLVSAVQSALRARSRQYQIRDQIERQLRAEQALRDADRHKDTFLATLAHELRNPLAAIRNGVQVMARGPAAGPREREMLSMMGRQSEQLVRLIDDLLDVSRIATGKLLLATERLDLRGIVSAALESSRSGADAKARAIRVDLPTDPVWVVGDAVRLTQIVGNLLGNAVKYTPEGGRIEVSLAADGGDAVVRVVDDGAGIPADMLERVFDMFAQVNRTLDRAQGGLGIGLALVRQMVELHGGSIAASSAGLERGSTFTVRLPLAADAPATVDRPDAAAPTPSAEAGATTGSPALHFLVIDDNADVGEVVALLLEDLGHDARFRLGGAAGIAAAIEAPPDVVLCDIGMPGVDGHDVARALRTEPTLDDTLLVALTGWGADADKREAHGAGFDLHLTKPVTDDALRSVLARAEARRAGRTTARTDRP